MHRYVGTGKNVTRAYAAVNRRRNYELRGRSSNIQSRDVPRRKYKTIVFSHFGRDFYRERVQPFEGNRRPVGGSSGRALLTNPESYGARSFLEKPCKLVFNVRFRRAS